MNFDFTPLFHATLPIKAHLFFIACAVVFGLAQFLLPKRGKRHHMVGYLAISSIIAGSLSAMAILDRPVPPNIGPLSLLHLLVPFTIFMAWRAVRAARRKDFRAHRFSMIMLYIFGMGTPFAFAIAQKGRILHQILFP